MNDVSFPLPNRAAIPAPIGHTQAMVDVLAAAEDVAPASTTVLLLGESGTGKEIFARYIHALSPRAQLPWVAVNCAALPAELLESELFGHEKGSFTGASERRVGRIEQADRGTLLLDEISEMSLPLQAKLLRVLQEREVDRVGGTRPVPIDVRIITTSNRDLTTMVARGEFRADLYYRLSVFPITLPPLRQRRNDIPILAEHLAMEIALRLGRPTPSLSPEALDHLLTYDFPGNVRELANILERALVRCHSAVLPVENIEAALRVVETSNMRSLSTPKDVLTPPGAGNQDDSSTHLQSIPTGLTLHLPSLERMAILEALRRVHGNRTHAARILGISLRTLRNKIRGLRESELISPATTVARDSQQESAA
jgi:transcriptional regulator with GAF, ATPase, and Fis domain